MNTVSKTMEVVPIVGGAGMLWSHPSVVAALILGGASVLVALINLYAKKK